MKDQAKQAITAIESDLAARRTDTVETAGLLYLDAKELKNLGDRNMNRAKKILRGYDPAVYGEIEIRYETVNTLYPDMDEIERFYAKHGETVPYKPAQPGIRIDYVDKGAKR